LKDENVLYMCCTCVFQ
jgi:hypothetical protein